MTLNEKTYTRAEVEAAVKRALEGAADRMRQAAATEDEMGHTINAALFDTAVSLIRAIDPARSLLMEEVMSDLNPYEEGLAVDLAKAQERIKELEAELHLMKTSGIIEVAVRNPSVMEYMKHWEGRAEAAEAKLAKVMKILDAYGENEEHTSGRVSRFMYEMTGGK